MEQNFWFFVDLFNLPIYYTTNALIASKLFVKVFRIMVPSLPGSCLRLDLFRSGIPEEFFHLASVQ